MLADLEKQHASLSAQIEESKRGKEDSVSAQQHLVFSLPLGCMPYNGPVMYTQEHICDICTHASPAAEA